MSQPVSVRFLQLSDVHLGQSLALSKLGYSPASAAARAREIREAFTAAMRLAADEACDGVLIPGDLFNAEDADDAVAGEAFAAIRALAPRPVFLTPGNHDPFSPDGPYGQARWRLLASGEGPPENLVLFREERFRTVPWPGRPDVTVTGAAFLRPAMVMERRLARPVVDPASLAPDGLHLALLHGSRDDAGFLEANKATLPFSAAELADQPFDYTAVGHYHASSPIRHPGTNEILGGYSGMPAFLGLDEPGEKSVLLVEVSVWPGTPRRRAVRVERRVVDRRRLHRLDLDVSDRRDADQLSAALAQAWETAGVRPDDVVDVRLSGRLAAEFGRSELREAAEAWLAGRCWHAVVRLTDLEPELDISRFLEGDARTLQARFAGELSARAAQSPPGREREIARRALFYGLEAIVNGRIRRRWEPDCAASPSAALGPIEGGTPPFAEPSAAPPAPPPSPRPEGGGA